MNARIITTALLVLGLAADAGAQLTGISNIITDSSSGVQIAGFSNHIGHYASGIDIAGFMNTARSSKGLELAGFAGLTRKR